MHCRLMRKSFGAMRVGIAYWRQAESRSSLMVLPVTGWRNRGAISHNGRNTNNLSAILGWGMVSSGVFMVSLS